jgi:hypothetical protein
MFKSLSVVLISFLSFFGFNTTSKPSHFVYIEETSGQTITTTWDVIKKDENLVITGINDLNTTTLKTDLKYGQKEYKYFTKNGSTNYEIMKNNSNIIAKGKYDNKVMDETHNISNEIWIQQLGFGLIEFAKSSKKKLQFHVINPQDFSINKLVATKQKPSSLTINDKTYEAQKIKITLTGIGSLFWEAEIWYDTKDNIYLKYAGNKGPNTPTTTVTLQSMK